MDVTIQRGADGIIHVSYPPAMDEEMITRYLQNLEIELKKSPSKSKIMTDTTNYTNIKMEQLKKIAEGVAPFGMYIEKSAMILLPGSFQKLYANLALLISKRRDIKVFDNHEAALAWLKE